MTKADMLTHAEQRPVQRSTAATPRQAVDADSPLAQLQARANAGPHATALASLQGLVAQRAAANRTGLPDDLRTGLESLSGRDLSGIRVHYNSPRPAQLAAHAFAQGSDIHLAPGQERHLPHEGWHAVQQMEGRVRPTMQLQGTAINDNAALEREADRMGARALRNDRDATRLRQPTVQCMPQGKQKKQKPKEPEDSSMSVEWWERNFDARWPILPLPDGQSETVPDLPQTLVTKIELSSTQGDKREEALYHLVQYLRVKGVFTEEALEELVIRYVPNPKEKGIAAHTYDPKSGPNARKIVIDIYPDAFKTPSILYSVLRHELIHAGQRSAQPDEITKKTDRYLHRDPSGTYNDFQMALGEIEAYPFEIGLFKNAGLTKSKNKDDIEHRNTALTHLASNVEQLLKNLPVVPNTQTRWHGYLGNALGFVKGVKASPSVFSKKSIEEAKLSEKAKLLAKALGKIKAPSLEKIPEESQAIMEELETADNLPNKEGMEDDLSPLAKMLDSKSSKGSNVIRKVITKMKKQEQGEDRRVTRGQSEKTKKGKTWKGKKNQG